MERYIWYIVLGLAAFWLIKRLFGRPSNGKRPKPGTAGKGGAAPSSRASKLRERADIPFERQWGTGPLPCDGTKCNSGKPCSGPERWMCRDVISKEVPDGLYVGQFWVNLPTKSRRIDFAIETLAGKRIAVELDGFEPHVKKLERDGFDDQLLRQNELVCAGWTVLRFSFDQLRKNPGQCKSMLRAVVEEEYSSFNKNPVLKGACPVAGCSGKADRLKSKAGVFFWKCRTCKNTFNSPDISPETRFTAKEGATGASAGATARTQA